MQLLSITALCVLPFIINAAESRGSILKLGDFYLEVEPGTTVQQAQETIRKNAPADETFDQFFCTPATASTIDDIAPAHIRVSLLIELCVQASQKPEYVPHVAKVLKRIHKRYGFLDWQKIDTNSLSITPKDLEYRLLCAIPAGPECPPIPIGGRYVLVNGKKFGMHLRAGYSLNDHRDNEKNYITELPAHLWPWKNSTAPRPRISIRELHTTEYLDKDPEHHTVIMRQFAALLKQFGTY